MRLPDHQIIAREIIQRSLRRAEDEAQRRSQDPDYRGILDIRYSTADRQVPVSGIPVPIDQIATWRSPTPKANATEAPRPDYAAHRKMWGAVRSKKTRPQGPVEVRL